jgi:hypothetical protein
MRLRGRRYSGIAAAGGRCSLLSEAGFSFSTLSQERIRIRVIE